MAKKGIEPDRFTLEANAHHYNAPLYSGRAARGRIPAQAAAGLPHEVCVIELMRSGKSAYVELPNGRTVWVSTERLRRDTDAPVQPRIPGVTPRRRMS